MKRYLSPFTLLRHPPFTPSRACASIRVEAERTWRCLPQFHPTARAVRLLFHSLREEQKKDRTERSHRSSNRPTNTTRSQVEVLLAKPKPGQAGKRSVPSGISVHPFITASHHHTITPSSAAAIPRGDSVQNTGEFSLVLDGAKARRKPLFVVRFARWCVAFRRFFSCSV